MIWGHLAFALIIGRAAAQVIEHTACPNVTVKSDFDLAKFVGKWYEAQRYFTVFELGGKCVTTTYTANPNGTIDIVNSLIATVTGDRYFINGTANEVANEKGKLTALFPPMEVPEAYWVLDTDYDSFAIIWSCTNLQTLSFKFSWLLTREQKPNDAILQKAYAVYDKNGLSRTSLKVTDQSNCP